MKFTTIRNVVTECKEYTQCVSSTEYCVYIHVTSQEYERVNTITRFQEYKTQEGLSWHDVESHEYIIEHEIARAVEYQTEITCHDTIEEVFVSHMTVYALEVSHAELHEQYITSRTIRQTWTAPRLYNADRRKW